MDLFVTIGIKKKCFVEIGLFLNADDQPPFWLFSLVDVGIVVLPHNG